MTQTGQPTATFSEALFGPPLRVRILERNHGLDILRGLAALGIAAYHYLFMAHGIAVASLGTFGVYLFFMLSGLTMMMVYGPTFSSEISLADALRFYRNRIARILPLLCAVAAFHLVVAVLSQSSIRLIGGQIITSFLTGSGLFALHLPGYLSTVMGGWSLGIEIGFYAIFPVACLLASHAHLRTLIFVVSILVLAQQGVLLLLQRLATDDPTRFWHYYTTPLMFAPFFALGVLVYRAGRRERMLLLFVGLGLAGVIAAYSSLTESSPLHSNLHYLVLTVLSTIALYSFYCMAVPQRLDRIASFLGNISYALYLTHPLVFTVIQRLSITLGLGPLWAAALYFVAAFAIAHLTFVLFEQPMRLVLRGSSRSVS